jgi:hypothetical protein
MDEAPEIYRDETIRLCELAGDKGYIQGLSFVNCEIRGPAVLAARQTIITDPHWQGKPDSILWEVSPERSASGVIGPILALRCSFEGCTFVKVGYAGLKAEIENIRTSLENR